MSMTMKMMNHYDDDDDGDDAESEDDADSGPASKPPHASKKGKGGTRLKPISKLPPRKGALPILSHKNILFQKKNIICAFVSPICCRWQNPHRD